MKLQMEESLTLEKAISTARQHEYVKQEHATLKQDSGITGESVDFVKSGKSYQGSSGNWKEPATVMPTCIRCGKGPPHPKRTCPAATAKCHRCHKVGHYQEVCRTKSVSEVYSESENEEGPAFLGAVGDPLGHSKPWMVSIVLNREPSISKLTQEQT